MPAMPSVPLKPGKPGGPKSPLGPESEFADRESSSLWFDARSSARREVRLIRARAIDDAPRNSVKRARGTR